MRELGAQGRCGSKLLTHHAHAGGTTYGRPDQDLRRLALALDGTTEAPHFDRAAFKAARIYVTLAADGLTANFKFNPGQQQLKCATAPDASRRSLTAWGQQGWTTATLEALTLPELESALKTAWQHAQPKQTSRKKTP